MADDTTADAAEPTLTEPKVGGEDEASVVVETTLPVVGLLISAGLTLSLFVALVYYCFLRPRWNRRREEAARDKKKKALTASDNSVGIDDLVYIASKLNPESSHMDVLLTICSTPENLEWSLVALDKVEEMRKERIQQKKLEKPKKKDEIDFSSLMEGDWDEDDDDEDEEAKEARQKARKAEAEKQAELDRLKNATGQAVVLLEGIDDGVLGQKWVETSLEKVGAWPPPDLGYLKNTSFDYNGKMVSALDHAGLRRNLCMTMGRLNAQMLNTHPQLLEAGVKKLIDQTYFRGGIAFRNRAGIVLEAALRVAMTMRSFRLARTILEASAMFRTGCQRDALSKYEESLRTQYDCLPRILVKDKSVSTPDEKEIATGDQIDLVLELERSHAEKFTRVKLEQAQKQGIPPQVAMQTFREAWWMLLRVERLDGQVKVDPLNRENGVIKQMDNKDVIKYENEDPEYQLVLAWPMVISNMAQKGGKIKLQLPAPKTPGKYRFHVAIKSQDFLGADQEIFIDEEVKDASKVKRMPKKETTESTKQEEPKKDK